MRPSTSLAVAAVAAVAALLGALLPPAALAGTTVDLALGFFAGDYGGPVRTEMGVVAAAIETGGERLRLRLEVPYLHGEASRTVIRTRLGESRGDRRRVVVEEETLERTESGLGDLRLRLAGTVSGGGADRHRLEAQVDLKAPTADEEVHLGTGEWDARAGLDLEYETLLLTLFGGAGYNLLGDAPRLELRNVPDLYLGLESEPVRFGIRFAGWIEGSGAVVPEAGWRWAAAIAAGGSRRPVWRIVGRLGLSEWAEDFGLEVGLSLQPRQLRTRGR